MNPSKQQEQIKKFYDHVGGGRDAIRRSSTAGSASWRRFYSAPSLLGALLVPVIFLIVRTGVLSALWAV